MHNTFQRWAPEPGMEQQVACDNAWDSNEGRLVGFSLCECISLSVSIVLPCSCRFSGVTAEFFRKRPGVHISANTNYVAGLLHEAVDQALECRWVRVTSKLNGGGTDRLCSHLDPNLCTR